MNPTPGDVHVNQLLTQITVANMQSEDAFVALKVFPNIPVPHQSDLYLIYNSGDFNRDDMQLRAPGAQSAGGGYRMSNTPYYAPVWAYHHDIPDQVRGNADSAINSDRDAARLLATKMLIKRERLWASSYFTTGIWTNGTIGQATADSTHVMFWNLAASTPLENIRAAISTSHLSGGGPKANKLVLGPLVWNALQDHPDLMDRIKYTGSNLNPAKVARQLLAQLLELDEVLVMEGIYNAALMGPSIADINTYIGGKNALLVYATPSPGLMVPTAGYTFSWTGYFGASDEGARIKTFRMEPEAQDRVEIEGAFVQKVVDPNLGYFFSAIIQ